MSTTDEEVTGQDEVRAIYDPVADTPLRYQRHPEDVHPPLSYEPYKSTILRSPRQPLLYLPHTVTEITGPQIAPHRRYQPGDSDLTVQAGTGDMPIGERIIISGHVFDTEGKPMRDTLVEIWQANAAGRYFHKWDRWAAPIDPNFRGSGR